MKQFLEAIREGGVIIFDGAMGTQLEDIGLHPGPEWSVKSPETIMEVHRSYVEAGADALIANTFGAIRLTLERSGDADKVEEYNAAGIRICREAAGSAYVVGDISPTGQLLAPYGDYTEEQFHAEFAEQAKALTDAGADALIVETMSDLSEALVALKACKSVSSLPVIVSVAFDSGALGPRTMMGNDVDTCVRELDAAGADVIGANCGGIAPEQMAEIIARMRELTDKPLIAQPNAGLPELVDGRAQFSLPPEEFAAGAIKCVEAGAQIIGGCCGTTPDHIAALRRAVV